jgi:hypothetical protein
MSQPGAESEDEHAGRAEKAGNNKVRGWEDAVDRWTGTCPSRTRRRNPTVR